MCRGFEYAQAGGADRDLYSHAMDNMSQYNGYDYTNSAQEHHRSVYGDRGSGGAKLSHEVLGGAAGFEAMRLFEQYQERHGKTTNHAFLKEIAVGFAVAEAVKLWENHNRQGGEEGRREMASRAAFTANSMYDQKYGGGVGGGSGGYPGQAYQQGPPPGQYYSPPPPQQYGYTSPPPGPQQYGGYEGQYGGYQQGPPLGPPPGQYGYNQSPPPGQYGGYPPPQGPPNYPPY